MNTNDQNSCPEDKPSELDLNYRKIGVLGVDALGGVSEEEAEKILPLVDQVLERASKREAEAIENGHYTPRASGE